MILPSILQCLRKQKMKGKPRSQLISLMWQWMKQQHAAQFASLLGKVKDTRTNLVNMLDGEIQAEKDKAHAAKVAFAEGNHEVSRFFEKSMHDETRHKEGIKKILSKLQEKD